MSVNTPKFRECISAAIKKLQGQYKQEQAIAIALSTCRKKFGIAQPKIGKDLDSLVLQYQPIAREGVLPYSDGKKLKRWADLQKNTGRIVPILDEHPQVNNGNYGLYSGKEKVHGFAELVECPKGNKVLCANTHLFNGAPVKKGYSIGYPYEQVEEPGELDGQPYDSIQANLLIDHLALTNNPRDDESLKIMADAKNVLSLPGILIAGMDSTFDNSHNDLININAIAYDSLEFVDLDQQMDIMEIARKLASDNPDATFDEIMGNATMMFLNQKETNPIEENPMPKGQDQTELTEEEKKKKMEEEKMAKDKKSCDSNPIDHDALIRENAELKEKMRALDSVKSIETKYQAALDSLAQKDKMIDNFKQKEMQAEVQEMIGKYGADSKDFDGKTPEFISGALWWAKSVVTKNPEKGKPVETPKAGDSSEGPVKGTNKAGMRWSHKHNKFIEADSWDG